MTERGLFGGVFARGAVVIDDTAWLTALLAAEAGLARAVERAGLAPAGSGAVVTALARPENFDAGALGELAAGAGNPVPALVRHLTELVSRETAPGPAPAQAPATAPASAPPPAPAQAPATAPASAPPPAPAATGGAARAVHRGATSQDIIDTAMMLLARQAIDAAEADLVRAADAAARLADTHRDTLMLGRTLLQQAVPVTFGLVAAGWLNGLDEARDGLITARSRLAVQFGGAAGTLASLGDDGPRVARLLAEELGLRAPVIPWHTQRLRVIDVATALARVTAVAGKIARDVTLLAQTEVGEVAEASPGGSSAMPHKRNPATSVAILGGTRQVSGLLATIVASAEQELQRAAGAWHAEWQPFGQLLTLAGSVAAQANSLLSDLVVDPRRMLGNLEATGGLPLAEYAAARLGGGPAAHDEVRHAVARAVASGSTLRDVLNQELDPAGYLGAAGTFIDAALEAHNGGGHG